MEADRGLGQQGLVARSVAGDGQAFAALLGPSMEPAFRLASAMLNDPYAAEDVVQEASTSAWRRLSNLREGAPVEPWFLGIVANACRTWRRHRWWRVLTGLDGHVETRVSPDEAFGSDLDLRRAVGALPTNIRVVMVMRFYLDLSVPDIAVALKVPPGTVKSRLARGAARLCAALADPIAEVPT